ncbi:MAG: hypothetical protein P1P89_11565 [Desulfobacterales bacterium]|nr:hypothetical protein [Desulfobacterales bacterium]
MAKREKVILVIMSVVVVFGLYNFLFSSSGAKKKPAVAVTGVADTNKFIADVANSLKDAFTETDMYIIRQARSEWSQDPFWHMERQAETRAEVIVESRKEAKAEESRVYTGYLEMGAQRLAIINGVEYELGDELGRGGPVIKSIDPKQVVIAVPGTADEIILPLKETR